MLDFNSVLVFSEDPKKLADFYGKIFQKEPDWDDEGGYYGFMAGNSMITIGPHDKVRGKSPNPERIMLNFATEDVEEEFERIEKTGAKVIAKPYKMREDDMWIATFADIDGNYFQLMTPMKEMKN